MRLTAYKEGVHASAARERSSQRRSAIYRTAAERVAGLIRERQHSRTKEDLRAVRAMQQLAREFADLAKVRPTVDDFEDLLEITAEAYDEVDDDDDNSPDFARVARVREITEERDASAKVSITPDSLRDARLGDIASVKYNPSDDDLIAGIKQSSTVVLWQGSKVEAQAVTVDVDVLAKPALNGSTLYTASPYAEIQYAIDGFKSETIRVDVGRGTRVTVPANYLSVLVGMRPPRNLGVAGFLSGVMTIGAGMGMFGAPSQAPVMYTEYTGTFVTGASALVAVPSKAAFLLPPQSDDYEAFVTLTFMGFDVTDIISVLQFPVGGVVAPIPLTNDVQQIQVSFTHGTDPLAEASFSLPFQLTL